MVDTPTIAAAVVIALTVGAIVYQTGVIRGKLFEACRRIRDLETFRKNDMHDVYAKLEELSVQVARVEAKLES